MGVWATGLYSGDFAMDLRTAIRALTRLPFEGDKLVELARSVEPQAANDPEDADHTAFWLVVADQFKKHGVVCETARLKAIEIIDGGLDLASLSKLGMDAAGLRKREKMLGQLRESLTDAQPAKTRHVLKHPQAFTMQAGDVVLYPTMRGNSINPYFPSKDRMHPPFQQDGWGAAVILESGRAFDFLTWYRPLLIAAAFAAKPTIEEVRLANHWVIRSPGTCSPVHFKRMEMEKCGSIAIDPDKLNRSFPRRPSGLYGAVNDISIANRLNSAPANGVVPRSTERSPVIVRLDEILA